MILRWILCFFVLAPFQDGTFVAKDSLAAARLLKAPQYPRLAMLAGVEGVVRISATVDEAGSVAGVRDVSGPGALREAATEAILRWRYAPCHKGVPCIAEGVFSFRLSGSCELPDCHTQVEFIPPRTVVVTSEAPRAIID